MMLVQCKAQEGDSALESATIDDVAYFLRQPRTPLRHYTYVDEGGEAICRYGPGPANENFEGRWETPDESGGWRECSDWPDRVPYRWPDIAASGSDTKLWVAPCEADADVLASWGLLATRVSKFPDYFPELVRGRECVFLPGNQGSYTAYLASRFERAGARVLVLPQEVRGSLYQVDGRQLLEEIEQDVRKRGIGRPVSYVDEDDDDYGDEDDEDDKDGTKRVEIAASPFVWRDPRLIPPRPWLVGTLALRGAVSLISAPGGTGKSALVNNLAVSMAAGRDFLGWPVWGAPKRVWLWNLEDGQDELTRSITGCCLANGITPADLGGRLFVNSGFDGSGLCITESGENGLAISRPVVGALTRELKRKGIDMVVIDPFISSHRASENDNVGIDAVAKAWARVANDAGCAVVLVHHTRKLHGDDADIDSARGASALVNAARAGIVLNPMTAAMAQKLGIDEKQRRRYVRIDDVKGNRAAPAASRWFELDGVSLGNRGPAGADSVAVVRPWHPPDVCDGIGPEEIAAIQQAVRAASERGANRASVQSGTNWVGYAVAEALGVDADDQRRRVTEILKRLIGDGSLVRRMEPDKNSIDRPCVFAPDHVSE